MHTFSYTVYRDIYLLEQDSSSDICIDSALYGALLSALQSALLRLLFPR